MSSMTISAGAGLRPSVSSRQSTNELLELEAEAFRANFGREPFVIRHSLVDHPLFSLASLVELSKRLPEDHVKYNSGNISISEGLYKGPKTGLSTQETIRRIEECESWMVLKFVEQDPEYSELLDRCLDQVQSFSEAIDPGMSRREAFVFITSPLSITPYHMDPEHNFLLQIRGHKTINLLSAANRSMLSEQELENYFSEPHRDPEFKSEYWQRASTFELTPGLGLHFPVTVPHWVSNGKHVSISFSITFRTLALERRSIVYNVNGRLRKRGFNPAPYGQSPLRDSVKYNAFRVVRRARRLLGASLPNQSQRY